MYGAVPDSRVRYCPRVSAIAPECPQLLWCLITNLPRMSYLVVMRCYGRCYWQPADRMSYVVQYAYIITTHLGDILCMHYSVDMRCYGRCYGQPDYISVCYAVQYENIPLQPNQLTFYEYIMWLPCVAMAVTVGNLPMVCPMICSMIIHYYNTIEKVLQHNPKMCQSAHVAC